MILEIQFVFENQQFYVLRRCFYELFQKKKKKVLTLSSNGTIQDVCPMVEEYAQREIIFCDEKILIRPYC